MFDAFTKVFSRETLVKFYESSRATIAVIGIVAAVSGIAVSFAIWLDSPKGLDDVKPQLDAIMRGTLVDIACYDESTKMIFIHIIKHGYIKDRLDEGWYAYTGGSYQKQGNGSYTETSKGSFRSITPNTDGMICRQQDHEAHMSIPGSERDYNRVTVSPEQLTTSDINARLIALARGSSVSKVCYGGKDNIYFFKMSNYTPKEDDTRFPPNKWILYKSPSFCKLSNDTLVECAQGSYVESTPDITGLQCITQ